VRFRGIVGAVLAVVGLTFSAGDARASYQSVFTTPQDNFTGTVDGTTAVAGWSSWSVGQTAVSNVLITAVDTHGVDYQDWCACSVGYFWTSWSYTANWTDFPAGPVTLEVQVYDSNKAYLDGSGTAFVDGNLMSGGGGPGV